MSEPAGDSVRLKVNGRVVAAPAGASVAAALWNLRLVAVRRSPTGLPRGALCWMGVCFECRATIDGAPQRRTCTETVVDGMEVVVDV